MKIDNDYISKIIKAMEDHQSYEIDILELLTEFNIADEEVNKFYDHLKYMRDNGFIKSEKEDLGIKYGINPKDTVIGNCKINLTNKEFTIEKRKFNMTTNNFNFKGNVNNSPINTGDHVTQSTEYNITNNDLQNLTNQFNKLEELIKEYQEHSEYANIMCDIDYIKNQLSRKNVEKSTISNLWNRLSPIINMLGSGAISGVSATIAQYFLP